MNHEDIYTEFDWLQVTLPIESLFLGPVRGQLFHQTRMASAFERKMGSPPPRSETDVEDQVLNRPRNILRKSIAYALLFMLIIGLLTGLLFWATRSFLPSLEPETDTSNIYALKQRNIDLSTLHNPANVMYQTVQPHPFRQLLIKARHSIRTNSELVGKIIVGLVVLIALIAVIKYMATPAEKVRITRAEHERIKQERAVVWRAFVAKALFLLVLTGIVVVGLLYVFVIKNTAKKLKVKYKLDGTDKEDFTFEAPVGSQYKTFDQIHAALRKEIGASVPENLRLWNSKTEEEIPRTMEIPSHLVPDLVFSPPLAVFELLNFYRKGTKKGDADENVVIVPVTTLVDAESKATISALLDSRGILADLVTVQDAETEEDMNVEETLLFSKLTRRFHVKTRHCLEVRGPGEVNELLMTADLALPPPPANPPTCTASLSEKLPKWLGDKLKKTTVYKSFTDSIEFSRLQNCIVSNVPETPLVNILSEGHHWVYRLGDEFVKINDDTVIKLKYQTLLMKMRSNQ